MGPIGFPNSFMYFKEQQQRAMINAFAVIKNAAAEFKKMFKKDYGDGLIEVYNMDGAQYAVACMGTVCGTARYVVDEMRKKGQKVGLIKVRTFRPFPEHELLEAAGNLKGIAVLDKNISLGQQGALYTDLKAALKNSKAVVNSFIVGLGGRDVTSCHIEEALLRTINSKKPAVEWLY
jgi:pyruvate ferredoxin oxidoreductase alpha subunit